ncbi:MAG: formylglycine-generating enzyme family protein [Gemmataceae bacterium]|nr:formylglycine-generating enzyme family protein [Gemmataceae bacterium]
MSHYLRMSLAPMTMACLFIVPGPVAMRAQDDAKAITNSIGMKLVRIPAGKFLMGSPAAEVERDPRETQHEVVITRPFYFGVFEVTQAEYEKVAGANPAFFSAKNGGGPDHPIEQVHWTKAVEFCTRLSALPAEKKAGRIYRLPTEAEWEYACRAGAMTVFHFGDALSSKQANFNGEHPYGKAETGPFLKKTTKVGSYPANAWGLHDMHGNVWEWCSDWYDPDFYKKSPKENPQGPPQGVLRTGFKEDFFRVVRGGSWLDEARACRSAYRFRFMPSDPYRLVGFRVVCEIAP